MFSKNIGDFALNVFSLLLQFLRL